MADRLVLVVAPAHRRSASSGLPMGNGTKRWLPAYRFSLQHLMLALALLARLLTITEAEGALAQAGPPTRNPAISIAVQPSAPDRVLAGTLNAPDPPTVLRTQDGGVTWQSGSGLPLNISLAGVAFDPQNPRIALAGDAGVGLLFRSEDGGASWTELSGLRSQLSQSSAIGELYSTVEGNLSIFYAATRFDGVFRSADSGNTWLKLDAGLMGEARRVREIVRWRETLWAATHDGVYRLDPSNTWVRTATFPTLVIAFSITSQGETLYAGTGIGLYASGDGENWVPVAGFPPVIVNDVVPAGDSLVAATDNGIFTGSGGLWQQALLNGAPYGSRSIAVATIPQAPRTVYVGTEVDWVLRSDDQGLSFYSIGTMPPLDARAALATPTPTATPTPLPTPTPTDTPTPTQTPTATPSPTWTVTPVNTPTLAPPTSTPTATATITPTSLPLELLLPSATPTPVRSLSDAAGIVENISGEASPTATSTSVFPADIAAQLTAEAEATTAPAPATATPLPPTPVIPTPSPALVEPTATPASPPATVTQPESFDLAALIASSLPLLLAGAGLIALGFLIVAAVGILRGPRDL